MKALSVTNQKIWPIVKVYANKLTNRVTNKINSITKRRATNYMHPPQPRHLSMLGHYKSTTCLCQCWAVGCLIQDKIFYSKKGHNSAKTDFELSPLMAWIALWIVNIYPEFQVIIFSNNTYYKMSIQYLQ